MGLRTLAALAAAFAAAVALHLTWSLWPLESGLAFAHATLAAVLAIGVAGRAIRLESNHLDDPQSSNVAGPAWTSVAVFLAVDSVHGYVRAVLQLDQFAVLLAVSALLVLLLHVVIETLAQRRAVA